MAWPTVFWLVNAWDFLSSGETVHENWRMFRFDSFVYMVQKINNFYGNFLELSKYGGKGRRSFVIIPEGNDGKGWVDCRIQLCRLKTYFDKQRVVR